MSAHTLRLLSPVALCAILPDHSEICHLLTTSDKLAPLQSTVRVLATWGISSTRTRLCSLRWQLSPIEETTESGVTRRCSSEDCPIASSCVWLVWGRSCASFTLYCTGLHLVMQQQIKIILNRDCLPVPSVPPRGRCPSFWFAGTLIYYRHGLIYRQREDWVGSVGHNDHWSPLLTVPFSLHSKREGMRLMRTVVGKREEPSVMGRDRKRKRG